MPIINPTGKVTYRPYKIEGGGTDAEGNKVPKKKVSGQPLNMIHDTETVIIEGQLMPGRSVRGLMVDITGSMEKASSARAWQKLLITGNMRCDTSAQAPIIDINGHVGENAMVNGEIVRISGDVHAGATITGRKKVHIDGDVHVSAKIKAHILIVGGDIIDDDGGKAIDNENKEIGVEGVWEQTAETQDHNINASRLDVLDPNYDVIQQSQGHKPVITGPIPGGPQGLPTKSSIA